MCTPAAEVPKGEILIWIAIINGHKVRIFLALSFALVCRLVSNG
jgi:hypothetical protein